MELGRAKGLDKAPIIDRQLGKATLQSQGLFEVFKLGQHYVILNKIIKEVKYS